MIFKNNKTIILKHPGKGKYIVQFRLFKCCNMVVSQSLTSSINVKGQNYWT